MSDPEQPGTERLGTAEEGDLECFICELDLGEEDAEWIAGESQPVHPECNPGRHIGVGQ